LQADDGVNYGEVARAMASIERGHYQAVGDYRTLVAKASTIFWPFPWQGAAFFLPPFQ
jgi:hypothetical protein